MPELAALGPEKASLWGHLHSHARADGRPAGWGRSSRPLALCACVCTRKHDLRPACSLTGTWIPRGRTGGRRDTARPGGRVSVTSNCCCHVRGNEENFLHLDSRVFRDGP